LADAPPPPLRSGPEPAPDAALVAEVFSDALELPDDERTAFLDMACAGDAELRARVAKLLAAYPAARDLFRDPLVRGGELPIAAADTQAEIGRQIGPYRITAFIAAGGMGAVYVGERVDHEYEKRVAIKLIRAGVGNRELLARFRNERQVLANLEHPNIARLLEGGSTSDGQPYIVMEYVDGLPIDRYCAQHELAVPDRLKLFLEVCDAVQDAHRHLVIHRDLKPSNILVDTTGRVKLLDFGIAKITEPTPAQAAAEATLTTFRALTPSYASPEQLRGESMTTSADVYSLGVVLYKLLTETLPYNVEGRSASESERIVSDEAAPRPSRVAPKAFARALAGDLDTIVLKALSKEPERRYTSVGDLAADIRRQLAGMPVLARPDTASYRISKFVRRHAAAVAGATVFVVLLLAFTVAVAIQSRRVAAERDRASAAGKKAAAVNAFLQDMLAAADPNQAAGSAVRREITVKEILDEAANKVESGSLQEQPEIEAEVRTTLGKSYMGLGLYSAAEPHLRRALAIRQEMLGDAHPDAASSLNDLAKLRHRQGDFAGSEAMLRETLATRRQALGGDHPLVASNLSDLGVLLWEEGSFAAAESLHREALAIQRRSPGHEPRDVAANLSNLGQILRERSDLDGADVMFSEALATLRAVQGDEHPDVATVLNNLGAVRMARGDLAGADSLHRSALAIRRKVLGNEHDDVALSLNNLAQVHRQRGDLAGAEALYREALAIWRKSLGDEHPNVATGMANLGRVLRNQGNYADADSLFRQSLELRRKALGDEHPDVAYNLFELGDLRLDAGNTEDGEQLLRQALAIQTKVLSAEDLDIAWTRSVLGRALLDQQRPRNAEALLRPSLAVQERVQPEHWRRFEARSVLGAAVAELERFAEAESLLTSGYEGLAAHPSAPEIRKSQALDRLAGFYQARGRSDLATEWLAKRPATPKR
jgi:eukaryotic-like serine/threonine-protein kinase